MVVDPPDGRIPLQPWAAEQRVEIMANQDQLEHLDPRVKCLSAGLPRGNTPVGYNSYQILQVPDAVIILYEWNHHTRYIPLDGRYSSYGRLDDGHEALDAIRVGDRILEARIEE